MICRTLLQHDSVGRALAHQKLNCRTAEVVSLRFWVELLLREGGELRSMFRLLANRNVKN
jgi:hypothetical protein